MSGAVWCGSYWTKPKCTSPCSLPRQSERTEGGYRALSTNAKQLSQSRSSRRRKDAGSETTLVDIYEGERFTFTLIADHFSSFRDAWTEIPPALCTVAMIGFDPKMEWTQEFPEEAISKGLLSLSEVPQHLSMRALSKLTRSPDAIREGCKLLVEHLTIRQSAAKEAAAIVFVGSDDKSRFEDRPDEHALRVQETLTEVAPHLKSVIATSTDMVAAQKTLEDFRLRNDGAVLIVKQMARDRNGLPSPESLPGLVQHARFNAVHTTADAHCAYLESNRQSKGHRRHSGFHRA